MPKSLAVALLASLLAAAMLGALQAALAQAAGPGLPGAPQPTPSYPGGTRLSQGLQGGSGSYSIGAAANDHAAFLWVVDNVQHTVILCEKADTRDFTCSKKPLP
jgi:hypothetical protein